MSVELELSKLMVDAYTHQKNGELSLAIQAWNALLNHQAADKNLKANAHLSLGNLHQLQGNDELAIENMSSAIKANPNSAEAYFCLAYREQEKDNFSSAIEYFEKALALNVGNCYDRLEKSAEAINAYSQAITLDEKYIAAIYNRGNAYMKIAKDDFALEDLNKAIELDANFYQAYYNRGTLFKRMGKSSEAEEDLTKAKALAQQELEEKGKQ